MILYHGSITAVENPEIRAGKTHLDFGAGFYTTTSYEQAERWAQIKMRRENRQTGYVSVYSFDIETAIKNIAIKTFKSADLEWLMFVVRNRRGEPLNEAYDIYTGPVADDNIYQTIRLFEVGVFDADETVKRLKTEVLHDQWTFSTEKALYYCNHTDTVEVK